MLLAGLQYKILETVVGKILRGAIEMLLTVFYGMIIDRILAGTVFDSGNCAVFYCFLLVASSNEYFIWRELF